MGIAGDQRRAQRYLLAVSYTPGCFEEFVDVVGPEPERGGDATRQDLGEILREPALVSATGTFAALHKGWTTPGAIRVPYRGWSGGSSQGQR